MKKKKVVVYRHIRLDNEETFYIGIGSIDRAFSKQNRNVIWKNIVNKTEWDVEILFEDLTWKEACEKEKEFIEMYGRKDLKTGTLANRTNGGDGIGNHTEEAKRKISLSKIGRKRPDVTLSRTGKPLSIETKKRISLKNRGKIRTQKHIDNSTEGIRISNKKRVIGVHWSNTLNCWIAKISKDKKLIHIGNFNCFAKALLARKKAEEEIWDNGKDHFIKKRLRGINWDRRRGNWLVRYCENSEHRYVGSTKKFCEAVHMLKKVKELI
jgi:hypothetical protein